MGPQVGMALSGLALMLPFNSIQNFLVDAFFPYSGSAIAAATAVSRAARQAARALLRPASFHRSHCTPGVQWRHVPESRMGLGWISIGICRAGSGTCSRYSEFDLILSVYR